MIICFATNNKNKIKELKAIIPARFVIKTLQDIGCFEELPEHQDTIEGNSQEKALYVWNNYKVTCISDDSGLEVFSLNNEPGVFSARYAGIERNADANMRLLLKKLNGHTERKAQFRTYISYVEAGRIYQFEGVVKGVISQKIKGQNGFGYDPIFVPDGYDITFAEMAISTKNKISHRAKAVNKFVDFLKKRSLNENS